MNGLTHGRFLYSTCPAAKLEDDLLGLSILGGGGAVAMMMMMIRSHGVCCSTVDLESSWRPRSNRSEGWPTDELFIRSDGLFQSSCCR